jgi:hypothetical protein
MEKAFHFDCPRDMYVADACVISCFDARFDLAMRKFLKRLDVVTYDHVKIPGSVKHLAAPSCEAHREFVLGMVRTSMALHQPKRALLFAHADCGAYPDTRTGEIALDVTRAAAYLRENEPSLAVECYFADFDGIYQLKQET